LIRLYARALRGQRARSRPQKRGKNVSMIGAIALKGIVASINLLGATDGLTFEAFVIQNLYHHFGKGLCVWDNSTIHKEKRLNSLLESWGKINKFTPYSPDFNPIESFWSKLKNALRSIGAKLI